MIDFGLDNIDFGLDNKSKEKQKPFDHKDPYGMNNLAKDMTEDLTKTITDIKKDIDGVKKDYQSIKTEIITNVNLVRDYFARRKAERQLKMIQAFSSTLRAKLIYKISK